MKYIAPYIRIQHCNEELNYYQDVFGGEIKNTQMADGIEMFKGHEGKCIHAELHINENCQIHFSDVFDNYIDKGNNILLLLELESEEEIKRIYTNLAEAGKIQMELQDTFWGAKHAIVKDKNDIAWELNFTK